jgi:hypothetical protein
VPLASSVAVATLYPNLAEQVFTPPELAMVVYPVAREGAVLLPSLNAKITIKSPISCAGTVTVVPVAEAEPTRLIAEEGIKVPSAE